MKYAVVGLCLVLAACQSQAEKKAEFVQFCSESDFTAKQCEVLYLIAKSSSDASNSAATATALSGVALGVSAQGARR